MPDSPNPRPPVVLAVLVVHDGLAWLAQALDALQAQTYQALRIVAVDNASTDGSRELLLERLGEDRVLVADRDIGFAGAVSMALDAVPADDTPYVLTLHDDVLLAEDAVEHLVTAMEADPRLGVVGPKLRSWDDPSVLQALGYTIDPTGRADSGVDDGELDQGQRDHERRALYVSTAGMLVRRPLFERLGRLDRRFHVFRDDLDLCWRVWQAGADVEVVPEATAQHAAGATNYLRLGQTRFIGPRYFAERNTVATLLKNYGAARLTWILPLALLVGLAKVAGFVLTRRLSDAWQTIRAWLWNLRHLRETVRHRRAVQAQRVRSDKELKELFGRLTPRIRAYGEAMASWIAGGDVDPAPEPSDQQPTPTEPPTATRRIAAFVRRRPILTAGTGLLAVVFAGTWPVLIPGALRGGELAAWPQTSGAFLADHLAGWHTAGAFGTSATPSPAQAILGLLQWLLGGNAYLASRLALLLPLAVAWLLALRAAQVLGPRRPPRIVAATAYVLSPPALAALVTGRVSALVVLAVLPGLVAGVAAATAATTEPARAWRAVAAAILLGAIGGSFEPALLVAWLVVLPLLGIALVVRARTLAWRTALTARSTALLVGPLALTLPWSADLFATDGPLLSGSAAGAPIGDELWAWLLLAPAMDGFPGIVAGVGFVLAGLLGLLFGWRRARGLAVGLWVAALLGAVGAWALDRSDVGIWAGLPTIVTAGAFAGAFALAFANARRQLTRYAFGWRQVAAAVTAAGVVVSLAAVTVALVREPFDRFTVADPVLPSFLVAEARDGDPFRVLVLAADEDTVRWEVVDGQGPTMAAYGLPESSEPLDRVEAVVTDLLAGGDPLAAGRLGELAIRYVLVPDGATADPLSDVLLRQEVLEPRPAASGELYEVGGWLPLAAVVEPSTLEELAERGHLAEGRTATRLAQGGPATWTGVLEQPGAIAIAEPDDGSWILRTPETDHRSSGQGMLRFADVDPGEVSIEHTGDTMRRALLAGQLLLVLLVVSLALRPPGFARRGRTVDEEVVR